LYHTCCDVATPHHDCYQIPTISIKKIAELLGDQEKMVIEVYNHVILDKEDAQSAVEQALCI